MWQQTLMKDQCLFYCYSIVMFIDCNGKICSCAQILEYIFTQLCVLPHNAAIF